MFKIKNRIVGPNNYPLVIAELGINHHGSLKKAIKLVDKAWRAGADWRLLPGAP